MLYVRYPLSLRNVEDLLHERGVDISHETVRFWWNRFGPMFAAEIRRKRINRMRAYSNWKWHLDEVFVKINGEAHYLWRAVDHEGEVLESYDQAPEPQSSTDFPAKNHETVRPTPDNRNRQIAFIWRGDEGDRQCRETTNGSLVKQSGRKHTPAVSTSRESNVANQANALPAEIRVRSFISPKPFQSGTPSLLT